jgi:hypothetical protein
MSCHQNKEQHLKKTCIIIITLKTWDFKNICTMLKIKIALTKKLWEGVIPSQLILGCRWYALLLTRSVNTQLALRGAWSGASECYWSAVGCGGSGRLVVEVGWRRCGGRATCRSRLMALRGRLLGVLLFTEARSIGCAVQWSPMKPESWSSRFPPKSSSTCSYRWWLRLTQRTARTRELHCWTCTC